MSTDRLTADELDALERLESLATTRPEGFIPFCAEVMRAWRRLLASARAIAAAEERAERAEKSLRALRSSLDEAMNTGDGSYRP